MDDYMHHLQEIDELVEIEEIGPAQRHVFKERLNPLEYYSDEEVVARYRLSKECINELLVNIGHHLPRARCRRGLPTPPILQLLGALRYMATGDFQLSVADYTDMSQPTISRCLHSVSSAIAQLAPRYIKFPDPGNEEDTIREFSIIAGMPGVIGCVDGTHIPIKSPGGINSELYCCQKNYSLNIMAVCDATLKFTNLVINWPGSAHDSRIFSESLVCERLQAGDYRGFLLGDSGYPCRSYLLTPFLSPSNDKERHYNASHAKTRNTIERAFRVLKRRFAVLSTPIRTKLETTENIILACGVLHNIAITNRLHLDDMPDIVEVEPIPIHEQDQRDEDQAGQARRTYIVENFF